MSGARTVRVAFGVCGAVSAAAQFALARVTLAAVSGSELGVGLFLAFWLLFGGAGCALLPALSRKPHRPAAAFAALLLALGILLPASCCGIVLARRVLFGFTLSLALAQTIGLAALAALPVAFTVGMLFSAAARAAGGEAADRPAAPADRPAADRPTAPLLYLADAVGSFAGGLLASLVLAPRVPTIAMALIASAAVLLTASAVAMRLGTGGALAGACAAAGIAAAVIVAVPASRNAAVAALARARFPDGELVATVDSRYQAFTALRRGGSLSFYRDGVLAFFSEAGEREEEMAHLALLPLPMPSSVLVIGEGRPFLVREVLEHPVDSLEVVVEDEAVHRAGTALLPADLASAQADPRVRVRYGDPRRILAGETRRFGAIFLDGGAPETLLAVRPYTLEFLRWLAGLREDDGIVVLAAPSVESRLSPALLSLNASFAATLRAAFGGAVAVPGEYAGTILVAGRTVDPSWFEPARLAAELERRGIAAKWIDRHSLATMLDPRRMSERAQQIDSATGAVNTLERPALLLFSLEHREELAGGRLALAVLRGFRLWHAAAGLAALALVLLCAGRLLRRDAAAPGCAAAVGFSGMVAELSLLGVFQLAAGSLYAAMAGLVGLFMAGMAAGSAAAPALARRAGRASDDRKLAAGLLFGLAATGAVAIGAPFLAGSAGSGSSAGSISGVLIPLVAGSMALSGFASGACMALLLGRHGDARTGAAPAAFVPPASPSAIYAADLFGGAIGGVAASVLLLPVVGTGRSIWFAVMGYGFALLLLVATGRLARSRRGAALTVRAGP